MIKEMKEDVRGGITPPLELGDASSHPVEKPTYRGPADPSKDCQYLIEENSLPRLDAISDV